ncbi:MAG: hypothetical protein IT292_11760 [Deltaproteobacteria bacterium]|nr:hypothetical protein [Deltaproteobacteria bacterium]
MASVVWRIKSVERFSYVGKPNGDIVAFVPTIRLVQKTIEAINSLRVSNLEVLPCYADMPPAEYSAFRDSEKRAEKAQQSKVPTMPQRVIVATNYAETSVTLSNLVYVIDSGYVMKPKWYPSTCNRDYPTIRHTQAGCTQRKGRVGRVQEGEVFRLYRQKDFFNETIFSKEPIPKISRSALDRFLLTAKAAGIDDLNSFKWLGFDPHSASQSMEKERSLSLLKRCAAIDHDGDITVRGLEPEHIETEFVDFGLFVSESDSFACTLEVATFLAFTGQAMGN